MSNDGIANCKQRAIVPSGCSNSQLGPDQGKVVVYNTDLVAKEHRPTSIHDLADAWFKGKACLANPLFGTRSMHAAALFQSLGDGDAKKFFQSLVDNDVKVLTSNGEVRRRVANGKFAIGLTDTDDVNVAIQEGKPLGSGMEEIYQITSALKFLKWGREVAVVTDARFSGVSTGACIGHVGPEALAGGPIGKLHDGDLVRIIVDRNTLDGTVDLVGDGTREFTPEEGVKILANRSTRNDIQPDVDLPDDTRLWAALQRVSGGAWGGCVYDVDRIIEVLEEGR